MEGGLEIKTFRGRTPSVIPQARLHLPDTPTTIVFESALFHLWRSSVSHLTLLPSLSVVEWNVKTVGGYGEKCRRGEFGIFHK